MSHQEQANVVESEPKPSLNFWMSEGIRVPGWVLVRTELSSHAKLLYGFLLDETLESEDQQINQDGLTAIMPPAWDATKLFKFLKWESDVLQAALEELVDTKLVRLGCFFEDHVPRFELEERHPWWKEGCLGIPA
jgi:hypothetical protein